VRKNEKLRKVIRGCGLPLTGFSRDMTEEDINKKLKRIIREHEDEGMREGMGRSEMKKVRASILGKREIEDLKQIPKILQIAEPKAKGREREQRKVVKKRQSNEMTYQITFPKTGDPNIDKESESEGSLSKNNPKKDKEYKPPRKK